MKLLYSLCYSIHGGRVYFQIMVWADIPLYDPNNLGLYMKNQIQYLHIDTFGEWEFTNDIVF